MGAKFGVLELHVSPHRAPSDQHTNKDGRRVPWDVLIGGADSGSK